MNNKTYALGIREGQRLFQVAVADRVKHVIEITVDCESRKEVSDSTIYEVELHNKAVKELKELAKQPIEWPSEKQLTDFEEEETL